MIYRQRSRVNTYYPYVKISTSCLARRIYTPLKPTKEMSEQFVGTGRKEKENKEVINITKRSSFFLEGNKTTDLSSMDSYWLESLKKWFLTVSLNIIQDLSILRDRNWDKVLNISMYLSNSAPEGLVQNSLKHGF